MRRLRQPWSPDGRHEAPWGCWPGSLESGSPDVESGHFVRRNDFLYQLQPRQEAQQPKHGCSRLAHAQPAAVSRHEAADDADKNVGWRRRRAAQLRHGGTCVYAWPCATALPWPGSPCRQTQQVPEKSNIFASPATEPMYGFWRELACGCGRTARFSHHELMGESRDKPGRRQGFHLTTGDCQE